MFNEKFWLAIAFLSFVALCIKYVLPKINNILDAKSKKIAEDILIAKKLREQAEKMLEEAKAFHKYSLEKSQKIIEDSQQESIKIELALQKELEEKIAKVTAISLERLKSEEESAIRIVKESIVNSAINQISSIKFNDNENAKINDSSLNKIAKFL
jgi:F-type H+-transporting ATPase subunit b